jgi:hypothetical protein
MADWLSVNRWIEQYQRQCWSIYLQQEVRHSDMAFSSASKTLDVVPMGMMAHIG